MGKGKTYEIDGRVYELLPPVLGVTREVAVFVTGMAVSVKGSKDLLRDLGERQAAFVARLITPQGVHPANRDLEALARDIEWSWPTVQSQEVVTDFFDQDGVGDGIKATLALNQQVMGMVVMASREKGAATSGGSSTPASSTRPSSGSPEETSSSGTPSSGPSASRKRGRTSGKGPVT